MAKEKHLTRRHGSKGKGYAPTWYCVLSVPRTLQPIIGKRHLLKSLETSELAIARIRKHAALAEFHEKLERARKQTGHDSIISAALDHRRMLDRYSRGDLTGFRVNPPVDPDDMQALAIDLATDDLAQSAEDIASRYSPALATAFVGVATGTATPLLHNVDSWLREGGRKGPLGERTKSQYRSFVNGFGDWCKAVGIPPTVEAVTKTVAGRFVTDEYVARDIDVRTSNAHISALSAYWRWMGKRAGVEVNPWQGQSRMKVSARHGDKAKRPFTAQELATLLTGPADQEMQDAIRVAALSGMRLEEIYRLTVANCASGIFDIKQAKTVAGVRKTPIHSELAAIIERRTQGKALTAYLFPEAGNVPLGRVRSGTMSKRFRKYRTSIGVNDREEGKRHSRVDFPSLRRWFVTAARQAGIDRATVAAVVGHEVGNLTDDTYSGGPSLDQRRRCVEAFRLAG